jgi:hypothetical protein
MRCENSNVNQNALGSYYKNYGGFGFLYWFVNTLLREVIDTGQ